MTDVSGQGGRRGDFGEQPASMIWIFGQIMMIPLAALVYGFELLAATVTEASRTANRGMGMAVGDRAELDRERLAALPVPQGTANVLPGAPAGEDITTNKEDINMSYDGGVRRDKDLQDDMLKLVRYKILFVRRDYEHAFDEREDLVYDSMDGSAFAAWKVAEFIQELGKGKTEVPEKWKARNYPEAQYVRHGKLIGLDDEDKKFLRVYYEVLERYVREKFYFEEQQIEILREIAQNMPGRHAAMAPAGGPGAGGAGAGGAGGAGAGGAGAGGAGSSGGSSSGSGGTYVTPGAAGGGAAGPGPAPGTKG